MTGYAEVQVEFLGAEEGGRRLPISLASYRPHFRVPQHKELLGIEFIDGPEVVQSKNPVLATVRLVYTLEVNYDALSVGINFEILEGTQVVGHGTVIRLW